MAEIDYSKYTVEDLKTALSSIDRNAYPDRVVEIERYLEVRLSDPKLFAEHHFKDDFFSSNVPGEVITWIWLRYLGWVFVFQIFAMLPVVFVFGAILGAIGVGEYWVESLSMVLYILLTLFITYLAMIKAVGSKFENYEIIFSRKEP